MGNTNFLLAIPQLGVSIFTEGGRVFSLGMKEGCTPKIYYF